MIKQDIGIFWMLIIPTLVACLFVLPNNLSNAGILFGTALIVMFIGRIPLRYILYIMGAGLVMFMIVFLIGYKLRRTRAHTWANRITAFVDGGESFQNQQARIAIANGGVFGAGRQ
jgi:cell division protein FtsW